MRPAPIPTSLTVNGNRPVDGSDGVLAGTARKAIDEGIRLWREANP